MKRLLLWGFRSKFCAPGVYNPIFECRSNFVYYFFTLFIRWNERTEAGCIRGVSYREMWWQWHYEAAQSLLTFDSRNDVSIPWRQNWSNSGSAFFKDQKSKIHFELRNHSDGDNGVTNRLTVDRGKTPTFKFILRWDLFKSSSTVVNRALLSLIFIAWHN